MTKKEETRKKKRDKLIALHTSHKTYEFLNPLEKRLKYKGKYVDIKLHEDPDGFSYIVWKNKKYMLDVIEKNQNRYTIMINGIWHSFSVETPVSLKRKKFLEMQGESASKATVTAPMPGKIIEVLVEIGSEVKEGEPVIILEAMKMQNEITSHASGVVQNIAVAKHDTVMKDDLMIEIKKT
ncbi:MAG: acetyl-CoA carboxylase biotin carboxyl carrier protein subunit [Bacteroidales bacterium]|nr:acetyl-CoA carboxylase biotin carboxyl carrier protein subunit [Bacteroidales bacterium]MBN2699361.1 acetyl-CoA carboxylase biotin carboxyl carrier protein subunit [Bacteroidales bacterium]